MDRKAHFVFVFVTLFLLKTPTSLIDDVNTYSSKGYNEWIFIRELDVKRYRTLLKNSAQTLSGPHTERRVKNILKT